MSASIKIEASGLESPLHPSVRTFILENLGPAYTSYDDGALGFILWNRTTYPLGTMENWSTQLQQYSKDPRDEDGNPCGYGVVVK